MAKRNFYLEAVEKIQLAQTYFDDGAPYSAARCLDEAAARMRKHADAVNPLGPQPPAPTPPDYLDPSDLHVAIGKDAFDAGYNSAAQRAVDFAPTVVRDWAAHREQAWSEYDPPEQLKGGG